MEPPRSGSASYEAKINAALLIIARIMEEAQIPGLGLGIIHNGKIVTSRGFGFADVERKVNVTQDTTFAIGSLTKAFTAAACGELVAEGRLDWNSPISTYLPEFCSRGDDTIRTSASIVDILAHATGLPDFPSLYLSLDGALIARPMSDESGILKIIGNLPIQMGQFREVWRYNALTYAVASMVIERTAGESFENVLTSRIFNKLGMWSTKLMPAPKSRSGNNKMADPYVVMPDDTLRKISLQQYGSGTHFAASSGIQSSIKDMLTWAEEILNCWPAPGSDQCGSVYHSSNILKELQMVLKPVCHFTLTDFGKTSYALGWFHTQGQHIDAKIFSRLSTAESSSLETSKNAIPQRPSEKCILFHSGRIEGFTSSMHIFPKTRDAIVVLGNSTGYVDGVDWISKLIIRILHDEESPKDWEVELVSARNIRRCRWERFHQNWLAGRNLTALIPLVSGDDLGGVYENEDFGLEINIYLDQEKGDQNFGPRDENTLFVSFFADHSHSTSLKHYHGTVYSFFPSRDEYEERARASFNSEASFLLHLHIEENEVIGLWWQYDSSQNGIWFGRRGE